MRRNDVMAKPSAYFCEKPFDLELLLLKHAPEIDSARIDTPFKRLDPIAGVRNGGWRALAATRQFQEDRVSQGLHPDRPSRKEGWHPEPI